MFVSDRELAKRYDVSRPTIWRWRHTRDFPAPIALSPGCSRWKLADVEAWEAARAAS